MDETLSRKFSLQVFRETKDNKRRWCTLLMLERHLITKGKDHLNPPGCVSTEFGNSNTKAIKTANRMKNDALRDAGKN